MNRRSKTSLTGLATLFVPLLLVVAAVGFAYGVDRLDTGRGDEARARLEDAIRRSCVACYAAEGRYPQDLTYLESRYGLQIDRSQYAVFYQPFGSNLMPDFTVLERQP